MHAYFREHLHTFTHVSLYTLGRDLLTYVHTHNHTGEKIQLNTRTAVCANANMTRHNSQIRFTCYYRPNAPSTGLKERHRAILMGF